MATPVQGLYEVEVPVAGQETAQRNEAIRTAFGLMLVKVTGNRGVAGRPELAEAIRRAPRYVQQYQYRLAPMDAEVLVMPDTAAVAETMSSGLPTETPAGEVDVVENEPARLLKVTFDRNAVERLLREKRLPVWDANRPGALVWIGVDQASHRRLGMPDDDTALYSVLTDSSGGRGVPLIFPLMDLEDQTLLQVADIWGDFEANIRRASGRYTPDLIINGRLIQMTETLWRAQWSFYLADQTVRWNGEGAGMEVVADEGMQRVADLLAERFAPVAGDDGVSLVRLRVEGVHDLKGYLSVGGMLRSQGVVDRADILFVEPDAVTFGLQVRGGVQILEQGLGSGGGTAAGGRSR